MFPAKNVDAIANTWKNHPMVAAEEETVEAADAVATNKPQTLNFS